MDISSVGNNPAPPSPQRPEVVTPPAQKTAVQAQTTDAVQQAAGTRDLAQLQKAVEGINQALQLQETGIEFSVDSDTKRTVVKVVDKNTGDLLRQIPSEEALNIAKALDRVQGLLLRQKA
jgi:flagellar protein FlaG